MADYFTNFSLIFSLPGAEAQTYAMELGRWKATTTRAN